MAYSLPAACSVIHACVHSDTLRLCMNDACLCLCVCACMLVYVHVDMQHLCDVHRCAHSQAIA